MSPTGPYKRKTRLVVKDTNHKIDDVVEENGTRWIIRTIHPDNRVDLRASNKAIDWHTTLDKLPERTAS